MLKISVRLFYEPLGSTDSASDGHSAQGVAPRVYPKRGNLFPARYNSRTANTLRPGVRKRERFGARQKKNFPGERPVFYSSEILSSVFARDGFFLKKQIC